MKYFSFRNHTLASAVKEISKSINALPKLSVADGLIYISFLNRYGKSEAPLGDIDTIFPSMFRKSNSTSNQYTTRVYSELQNAKDTNISVFPNGVGVHAFTKNTLAFDGDNSIIKLPNKIDNVEKIQVVMSWRLYYENNDGEGSSTYINGGELPPSFNEIREIMYDYNDGLESKKISNAEILELELNMEDLHSITNTFGSADDYGTTSAFERYAVKPEKFYDELATADVAGSKQYSFYWKDKTNEIITAKQMDFGGVDFMLGLIPYKVYLIKKQDGGVDYWYSLWFGTSGGTTNNSNIYFKIHYKPIADITLSYDNDSEAQDERPYNQTGKLIDAYTASKLVSTYVDESASETLVRHGEYYTYASIPTCGQKVTKNSIPYVINQRSIDLVSEDLYQVEFNLSVARVARDENISADDSIEKGQIPDDNLMKRVQVYKDYVEVSVATSKSNNDTPYFDIYAYNEEIHLFPFGDNYGIGFDIKMDMIARTKMSPSTIINYVYVPSTRHNMVREMIYRADFDDNFIIGVKQSSGGVQTPIRYADANGEVDDINAYFVDEATINSIMESADFADLPQISSATYTDLIAEALISLNETSYSKTSYEIPVFEYIYEIKGDINQYSQLLLADNILERFNVRFSPDHYLFEKSHYYYIISDIQITQENALERWNTLFIDASKSVDNHNVAFINNNGINQYNLNLFSTYELGNFVYNTSSLNGKHIGIFAVSHEDNATTPKFIMAINYYNYISPSAEWKNYQIPLVINNWKI